MCGVPGGCQGASFIARGGRGTGLLPWRRVGALAATEEEGKDKGAALGLQRGHEGLLEWRCVA